MRLSYDVIPVQRMRSTHLRTNAEVPCSTTSALKAAEMPLTDQNSLVQEL